MPATRLAEILKVQLTEETKKLDNMSRLEEHAISGKTYDALHKRDTLKTLQKI